MSPKLREIQGEFKTEIKLHRLFSAEILDKLLDLIHRDKLLDLIHRDNKKRVTY